MLRAGVGHPLVLARAIAIVGAEARDLYGELALDPGTLDRPSRA